ncbi:hypothetical protein PDIG_79240 [Penicillium digitatum PHI26]|uniref:Uncharacterized protein n=2 Tax=Penicillium digitatum TaxID=36651 RepID=K9FYM7_PEND2|nr:hypothetical protein PDIP_27640 [Penicillium digitatum Pd1]EKV06146.1 hypothetical protein PDIG_79240 [Penicillium digitatum PHI26]EKV18295.1 hypothetical protein PDIP_27640 [Penicillium digitatum Pd1]
MSCGFVANVSCMKQIKNISDLDRTKKNLNYTLFHMIQLLN